MNPIKSYLSFSSPAILCILVILGIGLIQCSDPNPVKRNEVAIVKGNGVFVVNEGLFGSGNAGIQYINLKTDSELVEEDLFKPSNQRPLGDVFESMLIVKDKAWLIVNNSGKIEICNPNTLKSEHTIKGLKSPRFALEVVPDKIYVTDLYANALSIIDGNTYAKTGEITCSGWTEELIAANGKIWVSNHDRNFIYIINPLNDKLEDSVAVAFGGSSLIIDKANRLWVLCSGDFSKNKTGGLFCINPVTKSVTKSWLFNTSDFNPVALKQNPAGDSLYFVHKGVYKFSKDQLSLSASPLIPESSGSNFYGLGIEESSGNILVADAKDFSSRGRIGYYSPKGTLIKSFQGGQIPSRFLFW